MWWYRASCLAQGYVPLLRSVALLLAFLKQRSFGFSASISLRVFTMRSPFRVGFCLSSIGTKALPPPSWCLVGAFAMRSPLRVEYFSYLYRNVDSSLIFPWVWCRAFAMGSPVLGRAAYFCALDRNEGLFHPSILNCFAMGTPYGSSGFFLPLDQNEVFFGWLVGIPSGWGHPFQVRF